MNEFWRRMLALTGRIGSDLNDIDEVRLQKALLVGGADVISANVSELGLELAHNEKPDVITLELMMPDINGWQLCKMIRSFSQVPIIIISALDDPVSISRGSRQGRMIIWLNQYRETC
jgi:DNA-binding response OmpR family regulator